jgi:hypothetical protein
MHWKAIENKYYSEEINMKTLLFLGSVFIVVLVPLTGISQLNVPTISDLQVSGFENVKPNESSVISYTFKSNQLPDEVIVDIFMAERGFSRRKIFSSKKGEIRVNVAEKEGGYEIVATRDGSPLPATAEGYNVEQEVWIKSAGKDSNKLKIVIPIKFKSSMVPRASERAGFLQLGVQG